MSFCANVSELYRELRTAAGTVLTTLGSRLEADARAQAEWGPQWLTEFEEAREVIEPGDVCVCWVGHGGCGGCSGVPGILHEPACGWEQNPDCPVHGEPCAWVDSDIPPMPRNYEDVPVRVHSSAAVPDAADPSPAPSYLGEQSRGAGDEGSGGASDILQSAPPEHLDMHPDAVYGRLYVEQAQRRKSDPGEVFTPSPGDIDESPSARELANYIYRSLRNADYEPESMYVARSLLGGFNITRRA